MEKFHNCHCEAFLSIGGNSTDIWVQVLNGDLGQGMPIEERDVLSTNAIIIVGVLFFVSISPPEIIGVVRSTTVYLTIPFTISSLLLLLNIRPREKQNLSLTTTSKIAIAFSVIGYTYLALISLLFGSVFAGL